MFHVLFSQATSINLSNAPLNTTSLHSLSRSLIYWRASCLLFLPFLAINYYLLMAIREPRSRITLVILRNFPTFRQQIRHESRYTRDIILINTARTPVSIAMGIWSRDNIPLPCMLAPSPSSSPYRATHISNHWNIVLFRCRSKPAQCFKKSSIGFPIQEPLEVHPRFNHEVSGSEHESRNTFYGSDLLAVFHALSDSICGIRQMWAFGVATL